MTARKATAATTHVVEALKVVTGASVEGEMPRTTIVIPPPRFQKGRFILNGTAPYVMNKMSAHQKGLIIAKQMAGSVSRKGQKRDPKDFDKVYRGAMHVSTDGWYGIPAGAFRSALVSACSVVGFHMTKAKKCVFVESDGYDEEDGQPLVRIKGEPKRRDMAVRLADDSTDIMPRPFFEQWEIQLNLKWDADMFSVTDVANLVMRAGVQIGIGAGRPDSRSSVGMGFGTWEVKL